MSFVGDFGDLLPDTITVTPVASRNAYGEEVAGTPVTYKGRVMHRQQMARNDRGEEKITRIQVVLNTSAPIAPESKVTLPNGSVETIFSIEVFRDDLNRVHHTVVRL